MRGARHWIKGIMRSPASSACHGSMCILSARKAIVGPPISLSLPPPAGNLSLSLSANRHDARRSSPNVGRAGALVSMRRRRRALCRRRPCGRAPAQDHKRQDRRNRRDPRNPQERRIHGTAAIHGIAARPWIATRHGTIPKAMASPQLRRSQQPKRPPQPTGLILGQFGPALLQIEPNLVGIAQICPTSDQAKLNLRQLPAISLNIEPNSTEIAESCQKSGQAWPKFGQTRPNPRNFGGLDGTQHSSP